MIDETLTQLYETSIKTHWDQPALSDYKGKTQSYGDVGRNITYLHYLFKQQGLEPGDKV